MKLQDLDDLAPPEPDTELLASVRARSNARRARHRRGIALATVALVLVVGGAGVARRQSRTTGPTISVYEPPPSGPVKIAGSWTPVLPRIRASTDPNYRWRIAPQLRFDGRREWTGSDGCNSLRGVYELGRTGAFHVSSAGGTTVHCDPPLFPTIDILNATTRVSHRDDLLTFVGADERVVAAYKLVPNGSQAKDWAASARDVRGNGSAAYVSQPIDIMGDGRYVLVFGPISAADDLRFAQNGAASGLSFADDTPFTGANLDEIERFVKDGAVYLRLPIVIDGYQAEYDGFRVLLQY